MNEEYTQERFSVKLEQGAEIAKDNNKHHATSRSAYPYPYPLEKTQ